MKQHNRYFCHNGTRVKNDTLGDHASQLKTVDTRDGEDARRHGKGQGEKTIEQRDVALLTALLLFPLLDTSNLTNCAKDTDCPYVISNTVQASPEV